MKTPEAERGFVIAQMNDLRDRSYGQLTRGWWWRGVLVGLVVGCCVGALIVAALFKITGNLG